MSIKLTRFLCDPAGSLFASLFFTAPFNTRPNTRFTTLLATLLVAIFTQSPVYAGTIVVYGDSISAAYGMDRKEGWVYLLSDRVTRSHPQHKVINASVSGETTGGGVTRLPKTLEVHQPDIIILELGGNDGLRGYPIAKIRENIDIMIQQSLNAGTRVLLIGMVLPPNYGRRYTHAFEAAFTSLAEQYAIPFIPYLLEGVTTEEALIQRDGIHPTAAAQPKLLEDVWPSLRPLLDR